MRFFVSNIARIYVLLEDIDREEFELLRTAMEGGSVVANTTTNIEKHCHCSKASLASVDIVLFVSRYRAL